MISFSWQQNRPYSHLQVYDNLHGAVKKTDVPKILDKLVEQGTGHECT